MAEETRTPPSFSRRRKWSIAFNVMLATIAVLAVAVALNYISSQFFSRRLYLSTRARTELSPRTRNLLHSLTNQVHVTLYYDKDNSIYNDVAALLNEYRLLNPKISVETVDYERDPGAAQKIKDKYKFNSPAEKNFVIFDCAGRPPFFVPGDELAQYTLEQIPSEDAKKPEFRRKPIAFNGEISFTSALLAVINPRRVKAYFLEGHGEASIDDAKSESGFAKFAEVLQRNYVQVGTLSLLGTNAVPLDCNLLIIAGPKDAVQGVELDKIEQYLSQGGRLFIAFNAFSINRETGLEKILAKWGVNVSHSIVKDLVNYAYAAGADVVVENFTNHPVVSALVGERLYMVQPRMISKLNLPSQTGDVPNVSEIAFSSPNSLLSDNSISQPRSLPLMAAVEKSGVKGVVTDRGSTRILVVGDSLFLGNIGITDYANSDFVGFAVNWLLDRTVQVEGVGPRPVVEYRLLMTRSQVQAAQWILLAGMPGAILLFGGLVWLRRRK
jgi:gliding motility-associatede transport system auxiliary component